MIITSRRTSLAVAAAAALALAAPALASHPAPTSLNLRAGKTVVKAHHSVTFTATLTSKGNGVSGESANIVVEERKAPTSGHKATWQDQAVAVNDVGGGRYTFTVTPPIASNKNTQKDQYRAVFKGDSTYAGSNSPIITVTVKRANS
jgi:hypothetical protein